MSICVCLAEMYELVHHSKNIFHIGVDVSTEYSSVSGLLFFLVVFNVFLHVSWHSYFMMLSLMISPNLKLQLISYDFEKWLV